MNYLLNYTHRHMYKVNRVLTFLIYTGLLAACQQQTDTTHSLPDKSIPATRQVVSSHLATSPVVFDIPVLLRLSVAQVKAKLGPPADELQANAVNTERSLVYKKHGLVLSVNYFIDVPQVDVISLTNERDTTSFQYLLPLGNLSSTSPTYVIDTLRGKKVGFYRGIAVSPNPPIEYSTTP